MLVLQHHQETNTPTLTDKWQEDSVEDVPIGHVGSL